MQWPWIVGCFLLWLSVGLVFWRKLPASLPRLHAVSRPVRAGAGLALLILSAILLVGGFFVLGEVFGPRENIQGIQWAIIAILGAAFISMQCAAVAVMLSLAERDVTNRPAPPSIKQGKDS